MIHTYIPCLTKLGTEIKQKIASAGKNFRPSENHDRNLDIVQISFIIWYFLLYYRYNVKPASQTNDITKLV